MTRRPRDLGRATLKSVLLGGIGLTLLALATDDRNSDRHTYALLVLGLAVLAICIGVFDEEERLWRMEKSRTEGTEAPDDGADVDR